jgi:hypothetical protein
MSGIASATAAASSHRNNPSRPLLLTDESDDDDLDSDRSQAGREPTRTLMARLQSSPYARKTLGICLLLVVVFLWTASNFLASVCGSFCLVLG